MWLVCEINKRNQKLLIKMLNRVAVDMKSSALCRLLYKKEFSKSMTCNIRMNKRPKPKSPWLGKTIQRQFPPHVRRERSRLAEIRKHHEKRKMHTHFKA